MSVFITRKVGETYYVACNTPITEATLALAHDVVAHGHSELELEMVTSKLNEALEEVIAEIQFLRANCQGEVV